MVQTWCKRNNSINYFECSAKENINVELAFETVVSQSLERDQDAEIWKELPSGIDLHANYEEKINTKCCR